MFPLENRLDNIFNPEFFRQVQDIKDKCQYLFLVAVVWIACYLPSQKYAGSRSQCTPDHVSVT